MDAPSLAVGFVAGVGLAVMPRMVVALSAICSAFFVLWRLLA